MVVDWKQFVVSSQQELAHVDVGILNLACTEGLPDADDVYVLRCVELLDRWADYVGRFTRSAHSVFLNSPKDFNNSEGYFRSLCLVTALQRDLGLRYNEAKIAEATPLDTADLFVHGALFGDGGTCVTIPVVYAAVGRRLGYPLKLVTARGHRADHLFCRWEDEQDRFNIEATAKGLSCHSDDYYRRGLYVHCPQGEREGGILQSQSPRQELSGFLRTRGFRWLDFNNYRQAVDSFAWAYALDLENRLMKNTLIGTLNEWGKRLEALEPPGFPEMVFRWPPRRFPEAFPLALEKDILSLEARENLLGNSQDETQWWEP